MEGRAPTLADGHYMAIDADNAPPPVIAPQDKEIARLGRELNGTYVAFGREAAPRAWSGNASRTRTPPR